MKSLSFTVVNVSSEDPDFKASNLSSFVDYKQLGPGWTSQRFCVYPQSIIIQFPSRVRAKRLEFLFHEKKIPSRVELFSYLPGAVEQRNRVHSLGHFGRANAIGLEHGVHVAVDNAHHFERIGHFSVGENSQNKWMVRELRSVYIDTPCQFIRLVFYKNHSNKFNIFNQVGLVSLRCHGFSLAQHDLDFNQALIQKAFPEEQKINLSAQLPPLHADLSQDLDTAAPSIQQSMIAGSVKTRRSTTQVTVIEQKMRILKAAQMQAHEEDDLDRAQWISEKLKRMEGAKSQIVNLELEKRKALDREDYDSAKILKFEIDKLKNEIFAQVQDPAAHYVHQEPIEDDYRSVSPFGGVALSPIKRDPGFAEQSGFIKVGDGVHGKVVAKKESQGMVERGAFINYDAKIPSAIANSKVIDYGSVEETEFNMDGTKTEEEKEEGTLDAKQRQIAGPILALGGDVEKEVAGLFSKNWQKREKALEHFISNANGYVKENGGMAGLMLTVQIAIKDKNWQVYRKAMELYSEILNSRPGNASENSVKTDSPGVESIHLHLFDKLAQSNQKVKTIAVKTVTDLFTRGSALMNTSNLLLFFLRGQSYLHPKGYDSVKHMIGRLEVIASLVKEHDKVGLPVNMTMEYVVRHCLKVASDKKMRELALEIIVSLYEKLSYKRLEPFLIGDFLAKQYKEVLRHKIPELDQALPEKKVYEAGSLAKMLKGEDVAPKPSESEKKKESVDPRSPENSAAPSSQTAVKKGSKMKQTYPEQKKEGAPAYYKLKQKKKVT